MLKNNPGKDNRCKLSDEQIVEIREKKSKGESLQKLGEKYNVSIFYLSKVCTGVYRAAAGGPITKYILTDTDVLNIREKRNTGEKVKDLAKEFNVNAAHITLICAGKSRPAIGGPITNTRNAVFSRSEVEQIRKRRFDGEKAEELALAFGVTTNTINGIIYGSSYKNYPGPIVETKVFPASQVLLARKEHSEGVPCNVLADKYEVSFYKMYAMLKGFSYKSIPGAVPPEGPRFTEEQVIRIRKKHDQKISINALADEYKVSYSTIYEMVKGIRYANYGGPIQRVKPKFEQDEVVTMRKRHFNGDSIAKLAGEYNLTIQGMLFILDGTSYSQFPGPLKPKRK